MSDTQAIAARLTAIAEQAVQTILACAEHGVGYEHAKAALIGEMEAVLSAHVETFTQQLEAIDKIVGPQGLPELHLVERAVLMRKQMDADDDRCRVWKAEVETLTQQVAELREMSAAHREEARAERDRRLEAEQQRDAAHAALEKFGQHNCKLKTWLRRQLPADYVCTCGLDAALAASAPQTKKEK